VTRGQGAETEGPEAGTEDLGAAETADPRADLRVEIGGRGVETAGSPGGDPRALRRTGGPGAGPSPGLSLPQRVPRRKTTKMVARSETRINELWGLM